MPAPTVPVPPGYVENLQVRPSKPVLELLARYVVRKCGNQVVEQHGVIVTESVLCEPAQVIGIRQATAQPSRVSAWSTTA